MSVLDSVFAGSAGPIVVLTRWVSVHLKAHHVFYMQVGESLSHFVLAVDARLMEWRLSFLVIVEAVKLGTLLYELDCFLDISSQSNFVKLLVKLPLSFHGLESDSCRVHLHEHHLCDLMVAIYQCQLIGSAQVNIPMNRLATQFK